MSHRQVRAWHAQHASTRGNVAKKQHLQQHLQKPATAAAAAVK